MLFEEIKENIEIEGFMKKIMGIQEKDYNIKSISLQFEDREHSFLLNEDIKKISECILPYSKSEIFMDLFVKILNMYRGKEENIEVLKCELCNKHFIIHKFERRNLCNTFNKCRLCGNWEFDSIEKVPFDNLMLYNSYSNLASYLDKYISKRQGVPRKLINDIKHLVGDLTIPEINVVLSKLRKEIFKEHCSSLYYTINLIETVVDYAKKNKVEFEKLINDVNNTSSPNGDQVKSDIMKVEGLIEREIEMDMFDFLYPHPMKKTETPLYGMKNIKVEYFSLKRDLYKNIFDLYENHFILSSLAMIYKGFNYDEKLIDRSLFGKRILARTKELTKDTPLEALVNKSYIGDIRNSIGHPNNHLDIVNKQVEIYNKGELISTYSLDEFMNILNDLINLQKALDFFRKDMEIYKEKEFLKTGGILSLQPDIEDGIPVLIINQLEFFEEFIIHDDWWKRCVDIKIKNDFEKIGIEFHINKSKSRYEGLEIHEEDEKVYLLTPFILDWINLTLNSGKFLVRHRLCKPILKYDEYINAQADDLVEVPVYGMPKSTYAIKKESIYGEYEINEETKMEFINIVYYNNCNLYNVGGSIINKIKIGRNDLCPCGSSKKFKKCHGK